MKPLISVAAAFLMPWNSALAEDGEMPRKMRVLPGEKKYPIRYVTQPAGTNYCIRTVHAPSGTNFIIRVIDK